VDIMQAFIRLHPDEGDFGREAADKVKKSTRGVKADIPLAVDDAAATATLARMRDKLKSLSDQVYTAGVGVNDDAARVKLAQMALKLTALNDKVANPKIDVVGVAKAEIQLLGLERQFSRLDDRENNVRASSIRLQTALAGLTPTWVSMIAAGLAIGPALLPVLAAVTAAVIGIGAAGAAAFAPIGLFAAVASAHLKQFQKDLLKVQAANQTANQALATPAGKRTQSQQDQIIKARQMTAAFKKEYGALAGAQDRLKSAFSSFSGQSFINTTLAKGMNLIVTILPKLNPLLRLGANAAQVFIAALSGWVTSGGLDRLVKGLKTLGSNVAIPGLLRVLHNLAVTFGALAPATVQFTGGAVAGLVRLTGALARWAQSKGSGAMDHLLAVVRRDGPKVIALLMTLAATVPNLVRGLNPLAPVSLAIATALARIIARTPPRVITAIAAAFLIMYSAVKLVAAGTAIWNGISALATIRTKLMTFWTKASALATKAAAGAQALLNAVMDANPILLVVTAAAALVAGLILLYKHSALFRAIVQATFNWIKGHWPLLLGILLGPIGIAVALIIKHWRGAWTIIQDVFGWIKRNWPLLLTILAGPVGAAVAIIIRHWHGMWTGIQAVWNWIKGHWPLLLGILTGPVGAAVIFIIRHWHQIVDVARTVIDFFRVAWQRVEGFLTKPFRAAFGVIKGIWDHIKSIISSIGGFFSSSGNNIPGGRGHGFGGTATGSAQKFAASMLPSYGWSQAQFGPLQALWNGESGWRWNAQNPTSPAYGIPQADPGSKMASAGADWRTNPQTQIRWGLGYIKSVYGDPATAYHDWLNRSPHWYAHGGVISEPVMGIGLRSGDRYGFGENGREAVTPMSGPGSGRGSGGDMSRLYALLAQLPAAMAAELERALNNVAGRAARNAYYTAT
jgi:phage-related protein